MASTDVDICSGAMEMLGHTPFYSWSSTSDRHHKATERAWPDVRDKVLARHPWNCAVKRVLITADVTPPAYEFAARFQLPTDWLRTLTVGDDCYRPRYMIEGEWILSSGDSLPFRYVSRVEDATLFPPHLAELMRYAVAARMAYAVTGSTTKTNEAHAEFERQLQFASALDSAEEDAERLGDSRLLSARF